MKKEKFKKLMEEAREEAEKIFPVFMTNVVPHAVGLQDANLEDRNNFIKGAQFIINQLNEQKTK